MRVANYPLWLSIFILLGPFLMISWIGLKGSSLIWAAPIAGAGMLIIALFYLSKRLHEHMEEVATLRRLVENNRGAASSEQMD
jgi:hypothetical protein